LTAGFDGVFLLATTTKVPYFMKRVDVAMLIKGAPGFSPQSWRYERNHPGICRLFRLSRLALPLVFNGFSRFVNRFINLFPCLFAWSLWLTTGQSENER
jgi:hypothetical protein